MLITSSATIDDRLQRTSFLPGEKALLKLACAAAFEQVPASDPSAQLAAVDEVIRLFDASPDIAFTDVLAEARRVLLRHAKIDSTPRENTRPRVDGRQQSPRSPGALAA